MRNWINDKVSKGGKGMKMWRIRLIIEIVIVNIVYFYDFIVESFVLEFSHESIPLHFKPAEKDILVPKMTVFFSKFIIVVRKLQCSYDCWELQTFLLIVNSTVEYSTWMNFLFGSFSFLLQIFLNLVAEQFSYSKSVTRESLQFNRVSGMEAVTPSTQVVIWWS